MPVVTPGGDQVAGRVVAGAGMLSVGMDSIGGGVMIGVPGSIEYPAPIVCPVSIAMP